MTWSFLRRKILPKEAAMSLQAGTRLGHDEILATTDVSPRLKQKATIVEGQEWRLDSG